MRLIYKRYFVVWITFIAIFFNVFPFKAQAITSAKKSAEPWCYTLLYAEDELITPNTIVIYLHGDCNSGSGVGDLKQLAITEHPVKYAHQNKLYLPDDTIFICYQTHYDMEMQNNIEKLEDTIHSIAESFPNATIVLGGHSRGGIVSYKVASRNNPDIDGYFFISGSRPREDNSLKLPPISNALVVFGAESPLNRREDFSNLFSFDISDEKYAKNCSILEESTNNAFYVDLSLGHTETPIFLTEDFFWEWLSGVTDLSVTNE